MVALAVVVKKAAPNRSPDLFLEEALVDFLLSILRYAYARSTYYFVAFYFY